MTNTNWQNYGGETTMSYFSQIGVLTVEQFVSASRRNRRCDRRRSRLLSAEFPDYRQFLGRHHPLHALHPPPNRLFGRDLIVGEGAVQTLAGTGMIHNSLNGVTQTIPRVPQGSCLRSCSWGPTAAASSTSTWPTPSRTQRRSPTSSTSGSPSPSRSPSPTPSARW